jgi:peptide/nickel transport system ATP-binding protein
MNSDIILRINQLKMYFPSSKSQEYRKQSQIRAVDDLSFNVYRGETLGLCGESGCGKSTLAQCINRLYMPTGGEIFFNGIDISRIKESQLRRIRSKISLVFQDPYNSLDPRQTVLKTIIEPIRVLRLFPRNREEDIVNRLLIRVGLDPRLSNRYPHELSGGQRQRVGIARALISDPELVILDEPISSLDASVQSQIINLLQELHDTRKDMTYVFISHDLSVIQYVSNRVAVMYLGRIVEMAETNELFRNPLHPYSQMLLSAASRNDPAFESEAVGQSAGCNFVDRCRQAVPECGKSIPRIHEACAGHEVACIKHR